MGDSLERYLDNDYWSVYTGILGLSSYPTTPKIKADFRRESEALVKKFRTRLEALKDD